MLFQTLAIFITLGVAPSVSAQGGVFGAPSCNILKPGQLVYCCHPNLQTLQESGRTEEYEAFVQKLYWTETLTGEEGALFFQDPASFGYRHPLGQEKFCGDPIPCETCAYIINCGNGILQNGEECDAGALNSDVEPSACRTNCKLPYCGDFITDQGEECDNGTGNSNTDPNACRTNCEKPQCGDTVIDEGETCDDGNRTSGDGCSTACKSEVTLVPAKKQCGDGVRAQTESCAAGDANSDDPDATCRTDCTPQRCGDGIKDRQEECDDGNTKNGDGCTAACLKEPKVDTVTEETGTPGSIEDASTHGSAFDSDATDPQPTSAPANVSPDPFSTITKVVPTLRNAPTEKIADHPTTVSRPTSPALPDAPPPHRTPNTGPAALVIMSAGAAAGFEWVRRRRRRK